MALQYKIREQKLKTARGQQVFYYAQTVLGQKVSFDELCEELADGSTVDQADVKAVVSRLSTVISRHLQRSCSVDCGELGLFRPSVHSKASLSKEDFDVALMKKPSVIFTPRKAFKECLHDVGFRAISLKPDAKEEPQAGSSSSNEEAGHSSSSGTASSSEPEEHKPSGHTGL